jgi:hypothetical protein
MVMSVSFVSHHRFLWGVIFTGLVIAVVCGLLLVFFDGHLPFLPRGASRGPQSIVLAQNPPYPPSPVIASVTWDLNSVVRHAPGSDLWPITWAADDNLYTSWGDGGGFGGTNRVGRVSLGVARIKGPPEQFLAENIFGGKDAAVPATFIGKSNGMLSVNGALYMGVVEEGRWLRWKIGRSADYGKSWTFNSESEWDFAEPDGAFSDGTFLTFGRDYQGARDDYVYVYSQEARATDPSGATAKTIGMFRVLKEQIMNRRAYEYFAGLDSNGSPIWTPNITSRRPVFTNPDGVGWGTRVSYNPGLDRYLLTSWYKESSGWGIFDAPEPWGPWTTVAYYDTWLDPMFKFGFTFTQKWMSADGQSVWMIFSGLGVYDSFNLIKASFIPVNPEKLSQRIVEGKLYELTARW